VVTQVFVQANDAVKAGDALFQLDAGPLAAELARAEAAVEVARRRYERVQAPRQPEEVPRLQAAVRRATVREEHARREYERARSLQGRAASAQELSDRAAELDEAVAARAEIQAQLESARSAACEADVSVARSVLDQARAEAQAIRCRLDRLTVRSPLGGVVLKRNVEPGELITAGSPPPVVVADVATLRVRAQVDEHDAPLLRPRARGRALLPGKAPRPSLGLRMLRIEPLALPKTQLTGLKDELVDTRVIEVVFQVEAVAGGARPYPGQVVDVFLETEAASASPE
jgi:multidrug resistance efflux pump